MAGIPWALLPKTFQHAIDITRRLKIRYLWIDSICIIQDSLQDWKQQATEMASIYQNAYLTICATYAASSEVGMYSSCETPTKLCITDSEGIEKIAYFSRLRPDHHLPDWDRATLASHRAKFPLMTRAWAYQERLLSPRLLHFCEGELMWECSEISACECRYIEQSPVVRSSLMDGRSKTEYIQMLQNLRNALGDGSIGEVARQWHEIVEVFSSLDLSVAMDKLPALSGVARQIWEIRRLPAQQRQEGYLAGLWRTTIMTDLRWKVAYGAGLKPTKWRAPSWSWASVDGAITFEDASEDRRDYGHIVEAWTAPDGPDPTGGVSFGGLVLSMPTVVGALRLPEESGVPMVTEQWQCYFDAKGLTVRLHLDCYEDVQNKNLRDGQDLLCLRLGSCLYGMDFCLVLRECDGTLPFYSRVGWLKASSGELEEQWFGSPAAVSELSIL